MIDAYEEDGEELPSFLLDRPELLPGAGEFLIAFFELLTDRQIGMAVGPIPAMAIGSMSDRMGLDGDELVLFRRCVRDLEAELEKCQPRRDDGAA